jgi:hypothetical protein
MRTTVGAEPMPSVASLLRAVVTVAALAATVTACADANRGYYRTQAQGDCLARGLDPGSKEFVQCVETAESAEYRRWSRGAPGH